jgi:hypothetical protein
MMLILVKEIWTKLIPNRSSPRWQGAAQDQRDIGVDRRNLDADSRVVERSERATVGTRQGVTDDQGGERFHLETQNPGNLREDLTEQGQSFECSDNQGGKSRSAMSKSEGQLLEDAKAGGPMLASALISHGGRPVLASPSNDDPLVYSKAVDELRRERSLRPSHVVDGGCDASQVYQMRGLDLRGLILGRATSTMEAAMYL